MATQRIVPTRTLQNALMKALGVCNAQHPQIEYLEDLAKVCPEVDIAVTELRLRYEHLDAIAREGLKGVILADDTPVIAPGK